MNTTGRHFVSYTAALVAILATRPRTAGAASTRQINWEPMRRCGRSTMQTGSVGTREEIQGRPGIPSYHKRVVT